MSGQKEVVVFLPYKASMWDSLESVYLRIKEDEKFEAYVIPIPYYERNSDGSLGRMHYEGDELPKNIPITSWQEYSLRTEKPDYAYIHNPYDNCNYVTTIHPMFYISELKKYCGKVIYIPYFVLPEINPDDSFAVSTISHFITTPVVLFADAVLVQSENIRKIYINEILNWTRKYKFGGDYESRECQEKRVMVIPSPKFERVLKTKKEDIELPLEWIKYIKKQDGTDKIIVLYNTSLSAFLNNSEEMLDKMEKVFLIFKEYKDRICLWWRPHPLIISTINAMRPQLLDRYMEIVSNYKKEDYGIYDDTQDIDRAVIYTDAYYGDPSSVIQLYQLTKKPLLVAHIYKQEP